MLSNFLLNTTGPYLEKECCMENDNIQEITDHLHQVFLGQGDVVRSILCAFFAGGHVLLEGVPGVGKTLIALALSQLLHLSFKRIQLHNHLLT